MTAVYVGMAGSGESYRIERVYRNADRAYGFAEDYHDCAGGAGLCNRWNETGMATRHCRSYPS
jgi:hypothetical protein